MHPRLQALLPQRALSSWVGRLGRVEWPRFLVRAVIRRFVRTYGVTLDDAVVPEGGFASFTAFFTRHLVPGARPLPEDPARLASPADGAVAAHGTIDRGTLLQAKGSTYSAAALLGDDVLAAGFDGGSYLTVYLSPRDYHRVHAPWSGALVRRIHHPGRLLSVSTETVAMVPEVFSRNERVVLVFDDPTIGTWALVLVGALVVGGIETVWEGQVNPLPRTADADRAFSDSASLDRGDEVGLFRAGSTVIALFARGAASLATALREGEALRMGQAIGHAQDDSHC